MGAQPSLAQRLNATSVLSDSAAALFVGSCVRFSLRLFRLDAPFPRG
jgi:hypothetical protein